MGLTISNFIFFLCLLQGLNDLISAQNSAPWRNRVRWVNNGQVFSLMSTGSEFHAPVPSRRQPRVYQSSRRDAVPDRSMQIRLEAMDRPANSAPDSALLGPDRAQYIMANSRAPGARRMQVIQRHRAPPASRNNSTISSEYSGGGGRTGENHRRAQAVANFQQIAAPTDNSNAINSDYGNEARTLNILNSTSESMPGDDPRNRNTVFYNIYPPGGRAIVPRRPPPGTGYGTRFFQNGLPDLVPDPYSIQAGSYIQRVQMYALRCAAEENCLARFVKINEI